MAEADSLHDRLTRPFDGRELKFFPVAKSKDGFTARVGSYIDARAVMDRLDEVVGVGMWSTSYRCIDPMEKAVECTLMLLVDGAWISKADVGYPNEARDADNPEKEPWKAAYSDALKRAAVQWGIGRYIYSIELERDWLPIDANGKFKETPRVKGSAAPATPQNLPAPPKPKPTFAELTAQMGFTPDQVEAESQRLFNNRASAALDVKEKQRLLLALEESKKAAVA